MNFHESISCLCHRRDLRQNLCYSPTSCIAQFGLRKTQQRAQAFLWKANSSPTASRGSHPYIDKDFGVRQAWGPISALPPTGYVTWSSCPV